MHLYMLHVKHVYAKNNLKMLSVLDGLIIVMGGCICDLSVVCVWVVGGVYGSQLLP
jgi:hypothetical protein